MRQVPLERDINIAVNGCSGFATSTQKVPSMEMLISNSRGTYLIGRAPQYFIIHKHTASDIPKVAIESSTNYTCQHACEGEYRDALKGGPQVL